MASSTETQLNKYSARITQPKVQGVSQAMLYATGLSDRRYEQAANWDFFGLVHR